MGKVLTERQLESYKTRSANQKEAAKVRDQKLREGVFAPNADIEAAVRENGRPDNWAGAIRDLQKTKKPNLTFIGKRNNMSRTTVRWIAGVIGKPTGGLSLDQRRGQVQQNARLVLDICATHPEKKPHEIADILSDEHGLDWSRRWIASLKSGKYKKDKNASSPRGRLEPLSFAQRKMALILWHQTPRPPTRVIAERIGLPGKKKTNSRTVFKLLNDNWLFVRGSRSLDVELFLNTAEELLRQELLRVPDDVPAVVKKYFDILPDNDLRRIAVHYGIAKPDGEQAAFAAKYLDRLSNAEAQKISNGYYHPAGSLRSLDQIASYVDNLPDEERRMVLDRRLLRPLSSEEAEPIADEHIGKLSVREVQAMLTRRMRRPSDLIVYGMVRQIEGFRPWSQRRTFLDATVSVYLEKAGIAGARELKRKTDRNYVTLSMSAGVRLILHFALVARGAYMNQANVRSRDVNGDTVCAPPSKELETMAIRSQRGREQRAALTATQVHNPV